MTSQASTQMGPAGDCSTHRWVLGKHRQCNLQRNADAAAAAAAAVAAAAASAAAAAAAAKGVNPTAYVSNWEISFK
jgi:hypothetical protein